MTAAIAAAMATLTGLLCRGIVKVTNIILDNSDLNTQRGRHTLVMQHIVESSSGYGVTFGESLSLPENPDALITRNAV